MVKEIDAWNDMTYIRNLTKSKFVGMLYDLHIIGCDLPQQFQFVW